MVAPDRDKLRRAFGGEARREREAAGARVTMREFLRQRAGRMRAEPRPAVALPPGEVVVSRHGPLWRRELRYPATFCHGDVALGRARRLDAARVAELARDEAFASMHSGQCLFLDTETTGLSGGAGTVVFNYGLAFFRGDELVVEQLFLRDFGEEHAVLHHIAARLWQFPVPVTFVGKSFDRHRIATRMALHKIRSPALTAPHLDLYHIVRREYGKAWPDARLRTVEQRLLGFWRDDDLPGSEAPAAFLDWIRNRSGPVDRVLEHNRLDVLSLCAALAVLAGRDTVDTPV